MENLRNLIQAVKQAKSQYLKYIEEKEDTCDRARRDELESLLSDQRNVVYNAVQDLEKFIQSELGIYASELGELTRCYGYSIGKNLKVQANVDY
jgi:hypothetical protein